MKWLARTPSRGMFLLGAWLIAAGCLHFVHISSFDTGPVLALLAIAAGEMILLGR